MIDDNLNLVLPVLVEDEVIASAFHTPLSRQVFEANYQLFALTKAELSSKGLHYQMDTGPRICTYVLVDEARKIAEASGRLDAQGNPDTLKATALLAEIKRLTMICVPEVTGWESIPVDTAIARGKIDQEDWKELESSILFFTCHHFLTKKSDRKKLFLAVASLLGGSATSLPITEYANSLLTSMQSESSAQTPSLVAR